MSKLETRNYVASSADIRSLARTIVDGEGAADEARGTYHKCLVATTIAELGAPIRQRTGTQSEKLETAVVREHLDVVERVAKGFYAALIGEMKEGLSSKVRHQKAIFARTSKSMLMTWIRAGNDVRLLAPATVTKNSLAVKSSRSKKKAPTAARVERNAVRYADRISEMVLGIADKQLASKALEAALAKLSATLTTLGSCVVTRDAKEAFASRTILNVPRVGTFYPMNPTIDAARLMPAASDAAPRNSGSLRVQ
jgi:hypothetical protein